MSGTPGSVKESLGWSVFRQCKARSDLWVCLRFCCEVGYTAFLTFKTGPHAHRLIDARKLVRGYDDGRRTGLGQLPKWRWGDWAVHASAGAKTGEDGMRSATLVVMRHGESDRKAHV